jgi:hypothetical protein
VDLFIHGIGGGKYDELTDEIARRFYGVEPPAYLVLSATLLLPLPVFPSRLAERRHLARELRDLSYNPQRHLDDVPGVSRTALDLAAKKRAWISQETPNKGARRERFEVLRRLTEELRSFVDKWIRALQLEIHRSDQELQANAVLERRDYPFCLYPEAMLRDFCTRFLRNGPVPTKIRATP